MTIACYCRTSTTRQKNDSQVAEIEKWLAAHGFDSSQVQWFIDQESGKTLKRPHFERLQKAVFSGQVKTVVVWKLDRLSRRLKDGVNVLADWCEKGIKVVVVTQQIELDGPVGRMIAALLLGLAEIELEYRRERQMAGIEVARKRGVFLGRQQGTTKAKPERAVELRQRGLKPAEIAQALGTSERTVQRYLGTQQSVHRGRKNGRTREDASSAKPIASTRAEGSGTACAT
jgi:DNA invertase Pin-like site-specific DNA recombinase